MLKRLTGHTLARRLAIREYLPMGAWIATWAMLGLALGHADAVRLLAAHTFVQAARSLAAMEITAALKSRIGSPPEVLRASRRMGLRIDAVVLLTSLLLAGIIALFLNWRGMEVAAIMVAILAVGIPARHPGGTLMIGRETATTWRVGASLVGVAGAAAVWLLGLEWWWAGLFFALRDWGGLLVTTLAGPRREVSSSGPALEPMTFREAAARTEATARRRLTYRIGKSMLGAVLGPFGSLAARTGRGVSLDIKLARFIPRHRGGFILFTAATGLTPIVLLWVSSEPAMLLLSAALARISASSASALLWWDYADAAAADEEDDDE